MSARSTLPALLVAAVLTLGACGTQTAGTAEKETDTSRSAAEAAEPKAKPEPEPKGEPVDLSFTAETIDGKKFDGQSLAGQPTLLWFWSPWCPTCAAQSPQIDKLADQYDGEVTVVGVSGLGKLADMKDFAGRNGLGFPNLADVEGTVWKRFGVTAQSTFVLLDANSAVVADGYLAPDELDQQVAALAG